MFRFFKQALPFFLVGGLIPACLNKQDSVRSHERLVLRHNWNFSGADTLHTMPAEVPGTVHTDLKNASVIPDPFYKNNALDMNWIEARDWTYQCSFELTEVQLQYDAIDLVFEGLDTYASVYINGAEILQADNMFRTWRVSAKDHLHPGSNDLEVHFHSPVMRHLNASDSSGFVYPADNDASKTAPFVRKAAYHYGWDWAPRMVTCGIWKPVYLDFHDRAQITEVQINQQTLTDSLATLNVTVKTERHSDAKLKLEVMGQTIDLEGDKASIQAKIKDPKRWWPNGSGEQPLYSVPIKLLCNGLVIDSLEKKIGLRTVELVNEPDSIGTSFYFKVNGQPLFMKGANYIPQDVFLPRVRASHYRQLLIAAKEANMNMLRVWGGGIYERDLFYELCDSMGLLVWQDFMFAGTMYPGDSSFVENVKAEVQEQIRRLRHHPCLALWCGNNEIDVAWHNWGWQEKYGYSAADSAKMWSDYLHLFEETLPGIVAAESPETPYVPTSPQSNWGTEENFNHGSMHYWGVWHGRQPAERFRDNVGRFMVEYGMQSYPEMATLEKYISPQYLQLDSPVMQARQKSYIGNSEIEHHIAQLGLNPQSFAEFVEASQAAQAHALEIAIDAHLNSYGHCMGSLLWQLNDCWPGPSWSMIDYDGRKKAAYGTVQEEFRD